MSDTVNASEHRGGSIWGFLLRLLSRSPSSNGAPSKVALAGANKIPDHTNIDEVRQNFAALLDKDQSTFGAHIRVLGLQSLRDKVGRQWPKYRRIIHMAAENALTHALSKSDRYLRVGDDLYLIAYADIDAEGATRRTDAIATALLKHLLGTESPAPISIHSISGRIKISESGLSFEPAEVSERTASNTSAEEVTWRDLPKAATHVTLSPEREMELALMKAKEAAQRLSDVKVDLGYAPIWDAKKGIVASYAVLPYRALSSSYVYEHQALGPIPSESALLALDIRCLKHGITDLAKLYSRGERSLICVLVKYSSLLSKSGMRKILEEASRVPDFLKRYLSVVIVDVPADFQLGTCSSVIAMLRQHFRFVVMRAPSLKSHLDDLNRFGMDVVAVRFPEKEELSSSIREQIQRWATQAAAQRIPLTVEYVPTKAIARELQAMNVPYLSGTFMGPLLDAPAGVIMRNIEDFPTKAS